jgi:hypothetical protein
MRKPRIRCTVALITFSLGVISGTVFRAPVPLPSQR